MRSRSGRPGYDFIFFEGKAEHPVYLLVTNGKAEIKDARHLWGKDTTRTEEMILAKKIRAETIKSSASGMPGKSACACRRNQ